MTPIATLGKPRDYWGLPFFGSFRGSGPLRVLLRCRKGQGPCRGFILPTAKKQRVSVTLWVNINGVSELYGLPAKAACVVAYLSDVQLRPTECARVCWFAS